MFNTNNQHRYPKCLKTRKMKSDLHNLTDPESDTYIT